MGEDSAVSQQTLSQRLGLPLPNTSPLSFESILANLRMLLHSRGMLCSAEVPCSVSALPGQGQIEVCLGPIPEQTHNSRQPLMCEAVPLDGSFVLKKGCSRGSARRCYVYDVQEILRRVRRSKHIARSFMERLHSPDSASPTTLRPVHRCAVVYSGHTLRCGSKWGALLDSPHYDVVLRAHFMNNATAHASGRRAAALAGRRVDLSIENGGLPCQRLQSRGGQCIPTALRLQLDEENVTGQPYAFGGLGRGRTGGSLLNVAMSMCDHVDLFGAGLFSIGPGSDFVYQHWYDKRFSSHCDSFKCISKDQALALDAGAELATSISRGFIMCRPTRPCENVRGKPYPTSSDWHGPASEEPDDFFLRSELRVYVLHALGLVNWIWY